MMLCPVIRASSLLGSSDKVTTYVFSIDEYFRVAKLALLCAQCSQVKSYFFERLYTDIVSGSITTSFSLQFYHCK